MRRPPAAAAGSRNRAARARRRRADPSRRRTGPVPSCRLLASRVMATRRGHGLRVATARGGVVNAFFLSGAEGLVLVQGLLATALLGPDAIGLYGVVHDRDDDRRAAPGRHRRGVRAGAGDR